MGRPVKFTDTKKEWFRQSRLGRERSFETREKLERFLIVCEGERTEPNYFEAFKQELPRNLVRLEVYGEGANTLSLIARALEIRDKEERSDYRFDHVWVVFDRDSFKPDDFDNAIDKATAAGMHCAWSNEAFELWYILHFEYRNTGMGREEYAGKLSVRLGEPYRKNAPDTYLKLSKKGNQAQAVEWSRKLHEAVRAAQTPPSRSNPCTTVFLLVEQLNRFKVTRADLTARVRVQNILPLRHPFCTYSSLLSNLHLSVPALSNPARRKKRTQPAPKRTEAHSNRCQAH